MDKYEQWPTDKFIGYANNPRDNDKAVDKIAEAIHAFGFRVPIIAKSDGTVIDGHLRLKAAKKLGLESLPVLLADDMSEADIKGFRISVNRMAELADWDLDLLKIEIEGLQELDFDIDLLGFDDDFIDGLFDDDGEHFDDGVAGSMTDNFIQPPFSVLDARKGDWLERKRLWRDRIGDNGESREEVLYASNSILSGISTASLLDPVMAEIIVSWFGCKDGVSFDPFAGDSVFGFVSGSLGMGFKGIELRQEQADLNQGRVDKDNLPCQYFCDSSENMDKYIDNDSIDLMFTCPPYADLEVYSDSKQDLSNMSHADFFSVYKIILSNTYKKLKNNRFAVIVIGEVRDKQGNYINTVPNTINIMQDAGYKYFNEIMLINSAGTLPLRAGKFMRATRKVGKMHQNVLVFLKGDARKAVKYLGDVEVDCSMSDDIES